MNEKLAFVRLPVLLLVLFFIGKLVMGGLGQPYAVGNRLFALVPLTIHMGLAWGAFARRYQGYGVGGGALVGMLIALAAQILIALGTAGSYLAGAETHFNAPEAFSATGPVPFGQAMAARAVGLVTNPLIGAVAGALGWALGALIPKRPAGH